MTMLKGFLLLFMIFSTGEGRVIRCPHGWKNFGLKCYKYFSHSSDWITAERNCQSLGANIASVRTKMENDFLLSLLPSFSTRTWVGGHDGAQEGRWLWSDGSLFHFTNWCSGEPNNLRRSENCLEINWTDLHCWNDASCSAPKSYVCARKL